MKNPPFLIFGYRFGGGGEGVMTTTVIESQGGISFSRLLLAFCTCGLSLPFTDVRHCKTVAVAR